MYVLKDEYKHLFQKYKLKYVAEIVGMNQRNLSSMIIHNKPCIKITAYALTKFLDSDKEILDFFDRKVD